MPDFSKSGTFFGLAMLLSGFIHITTYASCGGVLNPIYFEVEGMNGRVLALMLNDSSRSQLLDQLTKRLKQRPKVEEIRYELEAKDLKIYQEMRAKGVAKIEAFNATPVMEILKKLGFEVDPTSYDNQFEPYLVAKVFKIPLQGIRPDNADQEIKYIRINETLLNRPFFHLVVKDMVRAMEALPELQLRVVIGDTLTSKKLLDIIPRKLHTRVSFVLLTNDKGLWSWARDPSVTMVDGTILVSRDKVTAHALEDAEYEKSKEDGELYFSTVEDYARKVHQSVRRSRFRFEGGNIIAGIKNIFVGATVVSEAMFDFRWDEAKAIEELSKEFGRPVIAIGKVNGLMSEQPQQHIDLAMAVAHDFTTGEEVVLLESSKLARQIAKSNVVNKLFTKDDFYIKYREDQLNLLQLDLEARGYRVVRVPGLTQDSTEGDELTMFNYTNVIFSGKTAMVPAFGISELDQAAAKVYQRLGYKVLPMFSVIETFKHSGGPRCITELGQ